jgi:hypothetical protein
MFALRSFLKRLSNCFMHSIIRILTDHVPHHRNFSPVTRTRFAALGQSSYPIICAVTVSATYKHLTQTWTTSGWCLTFAVLSKNTGLTPIYNFTPYFISVWNIVSLNKLTEVWSALGRCLFRFSIATRIVVTEVFFMAVLNAEIIY